MTSARAHFAKLLFAALLVTAGVLAAPRAIMAQEAVTVFAAASLSDAVEETARAYEAQGGGPVRVSLASSSTLARQIEAGAPADIYLSANEKWMDYLAERQLIHEPSRTSPVSNRLVLVAPADSALGSIDISSSLDLTRLLGPEGRLAVGDPAHVPAGIYARQALEALGLWAAAEPRLARADNVRAALALVARGEAPLGIVYATDAAISKDVRVAGVFPDRAHPRITYAFAVLAGRDTPEVRDFYAFLTGGTGLAVFERFGFARD